MKKPATNKGQHAKITGTLHTPALPGLPGQIRLLVHTACAARGGIGCMTLDAWRDVEQQLKVRLTNER